MFNSIVYSCMKSDLMTAQHICTVNTLEEENISPPPSLLNSSVLWISKYIRSPQEGGSTHMYTFWHFGGWNVLPNPSHRQLCFQQK